MSFSKKADYIREQADSLPRKAKNWADFSTAIFGHKEGLIAKTFSEETERQLFYDTEQYQADCKMRQALMKKFGGNAGGNPDKSGRILVRLPKSIHKTLEVEASKEGVSLNQLAVSKLTLPLRERVDLDLPIIIQAYTAVYDGYSADRVVVDPNLNFRFLAECHRLGLKERDYRINHALLDARKSKKAELPKTTKRTEFNDYDDFQFASEIAVRLLQRSKGVSLDQILCDPVIATEFDSIAKKLVKQSPLKLRWAALNLRKTRRLGPMKSDPVDLSVNLITAGSIRDLKPHELPDTPGVYSFFDANRPLFAGETKNLQHRLDLHLSSKMPTWLDMRTDFDYLLKYAPLPAVKQIGRVSWLHDFITQERPLLNYQRVA
jgi:hypothetical protein